MLFLSNRGDSVRQKQSKRLLGSKQKLFQLIAGIERRRRSGAGGGRELGRATDAELNCWRFDARAG